MRYMLYNSRVRLYKIGISLFLLFNTFMIVRANRGAAPIYRSPLYQVVNKVLQVHPPFLSNTIDWYISWYSYLTGTDLMAVMFSTLSVREWWLRITATYADGTEILLPLPRQSPRTFLQRTFVDNKEAKFHNNIYGSEPGRRLYANYLCHEFPLNNGVAIRSVVFKIHWRDFLPRSVAAARGHHEEGPYYDYFLNDFSCTPSSGSAR